MRYVSTRGEAPVLGFEGALMAGLALDGGLYIPEDWPALTHEAIRDFQGAPYADVAEAVMQPFVVSNQLPPEAFREMIDESYATFTHPAVAPLIQVGANEWILELFHGPTLAFKDVPMQLLSRLMDWVLTDRGQRVTIIGATSGDTGGAAIEAFRGREAADVFILHPHGRVSDVQRRQMTTACEDNVFNIALDGTFDDCQAFVKALFNDHRKRDALSLAGVNSINWARIMAQVVYYFTSAAALGGPDREISYSVPTGNFGDVFSGHIAREMGLPIGDLIIATNQNDILARTVANGRYEPLGVQPSSSPSMDIQVSSNFERLLFELSGRDASRVRSQMGQLAQQGHFELTGPELELLQRSFRSARADEAEMGAAMKELFDGSGYLADPHTSVGVAAARKVGTRGHANPMVTLATAHPAKFPDAVEAAVGQVPPCPPQLAASDGAEERYDVLANDYTTVANYIMDRSRVTRVNA
ncbi:MAG: threonine synthase [Hyphomicrobiaceae bacterium]